MDKLYKIFYDLYILELNNLNIGYTFNDNNLNKLNELLNSIDYIENENSNSKEIIKIIQHYETF